jgi:SAM-dependent methyltransferase
MPSEEQRPWYFAVAERDHELQNPTSAEKIRLLGDRLRLGPDKHVLDIASGRGGPALILAEEFGCRVTGVEKAEEFYEVACERSQARGLESLVEFVHADARELPLEREAYDVGLCLGASFIWDGLDGTLAALTPAVRPGGYVCVGEPYWRRWPPPDGIADEGYVTLAETVDRFERTGLPVVTIVAASDDDWDRYVTLSWRALEEWLAENDDKGIRRRYERDKHQYLHQQRELLGWAIFVGWKRDSTDVRRARDRGG